VVLLALLGARVGEEVVGGVVVVEEELDGGVLLAVRERTADDLGQIGRKEATQLMKKGSAAPIPIHLNASLSHFSGLVSAGIDVAGRSMRVATKVASDVVLLE
jgi:hypothetical protein